MATGLIEKTILWIDDEDNILSSVRRLLRPTDFKLTVESNAHIALKLIENNFYSVIVSDQRMPQLTGIEVLSFAKTESPYSTRIMVTGFIDQELLSEALNKAGVFRYINKPWDDEALINDLNKAYEFSQKLNESETLRKQISRQNQSLLELNEGLEAVVTERTRSLEESRNEFRIQETRIRDVIKFVEHLNEAETMNDLLLRLEEELKSFSNLGKPTILVRQPNKAQVLYYFQDKNIFNKQINEQWQGPTTYRLNDSQDRTFLAKQLGRPISKLITLSLQKGIAGQSQKDTTIFIEFFCELIQLEAQINELTERLQPAGIAIDRVLLSDTLNRASRQWEKTFDNIEQPIAILNTSYELLRANKHFRENKNSEKCFEVFAGRTEPCMGCPVQVAAQRAKPSKGLVKVRDHVFEVQSFPLKIENSSTAINYYTDITEDQKLYGQLIQSEKMVALGQLAGNIAHELNNPLTGIQSLTQILISKIEKESIKSDLLDIQSAAIRSQNIIKNFQEFSADGIKKQKESVSLNDMIQKTLPFLKTTIRDLEVHIQLADENPKLLANQHLLQQVVFNLVTNAAHAMPRGGKLEVTTFLNADKIGFFVRDSGEGIPLEIQSLIFEPFFTTKKEGIGTGLGLNVCRNIVREFGGEIILQSTIGVGSEFRVEFPRDRL